MEEAELRSDVDWDNLIGNLVLEGQGHINVVMDQMYRDMENLKDRLSNDKDSDEYAKIRREIEDLNSCTDAQAAEIAADNDWKIAAKSERIDADLESEIQALRTRIRRAWIVSTVAT